MSRHVELFGDVAWERADASELLVGDVASLDLRAEFGTYTSYGAEDVEGLAGTGLENLNDAGSRWSVPVSGVLRFVF